MVPKDEAASVVWTDEMAEAMRIAVELMDSPVQARMAFLEKYRVLVREAREARKPPKWWASLGHDPHGRERALLEAVERGRLPQARALELLPNTTPVDVLRRIAEMKPAMLEAR